MTRNDLLPALDSPHPPGGVASLGVAPAESPTARLRRIVEGHYDAVWRTVRFRGIPDAYAEDVTLRVFCIAARKLDEIAPGAEQSFLLATAWRVASEHRRTASRRPVAADADVEMLEAPLPSPEELLDQKRARAALQSVLEAMTPDLRMVFVLFELEGLTLPEIATAADIPLGTATSRLRRAREAFQDIVKRRNAAASSRAREGCK